MKLKPLKHTMTSLLIFMYVLTATVSPALANTLVSLGTHPGYVSPEELWLNNCDNSKTPLQYLETLASYDHGNRLPGMVTSPFFDLATTPLHYLFADKKNDFAVFQDHRSKAEQAWGKYKTDPVT